MERFALEHNNNMTANVNNTQLTCWRTRVGYYLFSLPFGRFCTLVFMLILLLNGVWVIPIIGIRRDMSNNLTRNTLIHLPTAQYLYTSFLGLALGYVTGASKSLI